VTRLSDERMCAGREFQLLGEDTQKAWLMTLHKIIPGHQHIKLLVISEFTVNLEVALLLRQIWLIDWLIDWSIDWLIDWVGSCVQVWRQSSVLWWKRWGGFATSWFSPSSCFPSSRWSACKSTRELSDLVSNLPGNSQEQVRSPTWPGVVCKRQRRKPHPIPTQRESVYAGWSVFDYC